MSSLGTTIKSQVIDSNSGPNCTHESVVIGIMMPKSSQSVSRHLVSSSTSPWYYFKVSYWARSSKNKKISQIHKMTKFLKGSQIAQKLSWMSQHTSHEVVTARNPSKTKKPKNKIFIPCPKVPEIPRLLIHKLTWVNWAPLQSSKSKIHQ